MSIGNIKSEGNKGNNYPWQKAVLQFLDQISANTGPTGVDYESRTTKINILIKSSRLIK